ncbi:MAG: peptidase BlaR1 [Dehalococcoidales bacterium]|nr:peptidase BlaR1 [Dehalococcoidales bacterium]
MGFFNSVFGQYIAQSVFHAVISTIVIEALLWLWRVRKSSLQIKLRLLVLQLPVVSLPFYFLLYPPRAGSYFRQQVALTDFNEWLGLGLGGGVFLWHLFVALLALTTVYFIIKELVPSLRHYFGHYPALSSIEAGEFPKLDEVLALLVQVKRRPWLRILLSRDKEPMLHTFGREAIVISRATIDLLDTDELAAVISHELAHLGQAYRIDRLAMVLRFVMFYNPVALFIFGRIISDNEKNCDDIAIDVTGKRLALVSGILKMSRRTVASSVSGRQWRWRSSITAWEYRAGGELMTQRVARLLHAEKAGSIPGQNLGLFVTATLLSALLFFVV